MSGPLTQWTLPVELQMAGYFLYAGFLLAGGLFWLRRRVSALKPPPAAPEARAESPRPTPPEDSSPAPQ